MTLTQRIDKIYELLSFITEALRTLIVSEQVDGETNLLLTETLINMSSDISDVSSLLISIDSTLNAVNFHLAKLDIAINVLVILLFCKFAYSLMRFLNNVH